MECGRHGSFKVRAIDFGLKGLGSSSNPGVNQTRVIVFLSCAFFTYNVSLHPRVEMGVPVMGYHPIQEENYYLAASWCKNQGKVKK